MISCLLIQDFAAAVERHNQPLLKMEPLVIVSTSKRPKVIATSVLPRRLLVKPGMTLRQAQMVCPSATIITANDGAYRRSYEGLLDQLLHFTSRLQPEYQPTSAAVYLDTATEQTDILNTVREYLNVGASLGRSDRLFSARVAAAYAAFGGPTKSVESGKEAAFLARYPVTILPLTKQMRRRLPLLGLRTIGQLASLPRLAFWEQFGKKQLWIHELAQGIDRRTIQPYTPPVKLIRSHEFDEPIRDYQIVLFVLRQIAQTLAEALDHREAGEITLLMRLQNKALLEGHTKPHMPVKTYQQLINQLEALLYKQTITSSVVSVEIQLSHLQTAQPKQLSLFDETESVTRLEDHLPKIQYRHPNTHFQRARLVKAGPYAPPEEQFDLEQVGA